MSERKCADCGEVIRGEQLTIWHRYPITTTDGVDRSAGLKHLRCPGSKPPTEVTAGTKK